jgi:hypothetical protein
MRQHNILATSYSGLAPLTRVKDDSLTPVLKGIATRLSEEASQPVTLAQILQLWLRKKGIPYTT